MKEATQYLTLKSIQKNLNKVFGIQNNFFAEMLFGFISEHAPKTHVINFHQFFKRLFVFFPKKADKAVSNDDKNKIWRDRLARDAKKSAMRTFVFEFIRVSGGRYITILDLV